MICDEPSRARRLVQAQILNLLEDMKERYGLTLLFIAHDLAVVKNISDRCRDVPRQDLRGRGSERDVCRAVATVHRGTALGRPRAGSRGRAVGVEPVRDLPSPLDPPSGCHFRTRCRAPPALCAESEPRIGRCERGISWPATSRRRPLRDERRHSGKTLFINGRGQRRSFARAANRPPVVTDRAAHLSGRPKGTRMTASACHPTTPRVAAAVRRRPGPGWAVTPADHPGGATPESFGAVCGRRRGSESGSDDGDGVPAPFWHGPCSCSEHSTGAGS